MDEPFNFLFMLSYTTVAIAYSKVPGSIPANHVICGHERDFLFSLILIIVHSSQIVLRRKDLNKAIITVALRCCTLLIPSVSGANLCTFPLCFDGPLSVWQDCAAKCSCFPALSRANASQFTVYAHLHVLRMRVCSFSFHHFVLFSGNLPRGVSLTLRCHFFSCLSCICMSRLVI